MTTESTQTMDLIVAFCALIACGFLFFGVAIAGMLIFLKGQPEETEPEPPTVEGERSHD
jgi:hypothetical protein